MQFSGNKKEYKTGATRDTAKGKGRYDLIPPISLFRLARVYEDGAVNHGDRSWEKGIPFHRFVDSAKRHLNQWMAGMRDEDHLAQAMWNIAGLIFTEDQVARGKLPATLNDIPKSIDGGGFRNWNHPILQSVGMAGAKSTCPPKKLRFYVAASVRGIAGEGVSEGTKRTNVKIATTHVRELRTAFPEHTFYSPHEQEHLWNKAWDEKFITSEEILNHCFEVVGLCDVFLALSSPEVSEGVRAEMAVAHDAGIPIIDLYSYPPTDWVNIICSELAKANE
jgi:hypothetical protein